MGESVLVFKMVSGISSAAASATYGMQNASARLDKAAASISNGGDIASGSVDLAAAKMQMSASVAVERASDKMMGTLLNLVG